MSNTSEPLPSADLEPVKRQPPKWIPIWMSERERASLILAGGIVLGFIVGAIIVSFGIYVALHESPIRIQ